ncbi:MAG: metallophosphoesterase [Arcicella sp.]|jgi:calcineurin-like phosphoesterase family protein|nr:metallophosphoesterase [Arcicella sp.]
MRIIIFLFFIQLPLFAQKKADTYSLFLIGDAGNSTVQNDVHKTLHQRLRATENGGVVFLGDNIYPRGLDGTKDAELKLLTQLQILKGFQGDWFFIPGNHDWAKGRWKGYKNVIRQANYINNYAKDSLHQPNTKHFFPEKGLPGPVTYDAGKFVMIFTDTDWWLHRSFYHKVGKEDKFKRMQIQYFYRLDSILTAVEKQGKKSVFLSHHPIVDYGEHGYHKDKSWYYALVNYTPFQAFGVLGVNRALNSEMNQPRYMRLADKMYDILNNHKNVIAIAGHEHNLQVIKRPNTLFLISGSGSKLTPLKRKITQKDCLFHASKPGFMELIFDENDKITLKVWSDKNELLYEEKGIY